MIHFMCIYFGIYGTYADQIKWKSKDRHNYIYKGTTGYFSQDKTKLIKIINLR